MFLNNFSARISDAKEVSTIINIRLVEDKEYLELRDLTVIHISPIPPLL